MTEWLKPALDMTEHHKIVALYYVENEEEEQELKMDIFSFEGIRNIFIDYSGSTKLKMKEIEYWIPLPQLPKKKHFCCRKTFKNISCTDDLNEVGLKVVTPERWFKVNYCPFCGEKAESKTEEKDE